jgi:hypothetical protein
MLYDENLYCQECSKKISVAEDKFLDGHCEPCYLLVNGSTLASATCELAETFVCENVECDSRPGKVTCVPTTFEKRRFCSEECMAEEIQ